jgi:hypothetical protein
MRDSDSDQNFQNPLKRKWYDYQPSSFLRFIAILCIGGSSILSAALRVSQYSHYIAIVFGYITVVALLYNTFHDRLISFRVFGSLSAVALLLAGALAYYIGPNFPEETATHGWLYPANDRVPTTNCFPDRPGIMFILGHNISKIDNTIEKFIVLQVDKTPLIAVERDGDKLMFDVDIYNKDGVIAAKIDRGEFRLNPNAIFYGEHADKNPSDLTVYDDHNQKLLHIYYANTSTVFITGVFYSETGTKAVISDESISVILNPGSSNFVGNCLHDYGLHVSTHGGITGVRL